MLSVYSKPTNEHVSQIYLPEMDTLHIRRPWLLLMTVTLDENRNRSSLSTYSLILVLWRMLLCHIGDPYCISVEAGRFMVLSTCAGAVGELYLLPFMSPLLHIQRLEY